MRNGKVLINVYWGKYPPGGAAYLMLLIYIHHKERNKNACKMHVYEYPFLPQVWNQEKVCNRRHSACSVSPAETKGMEPKENEHKAIR